MAHDCTTPTLEECLDNINLISGCGCEQACVIRALALDQIAKLMCSSSALCKPVSIGDVRFADPSQLIAQLRQLVQLTFEICEREDTGDVIFQTIWSDRCGAPQCEPARVVCDGCGTYVVRERFHLHQCSCFGSTEEASTTGDCCNP
jgi:hypothetical protein